MDDDCKHMKVTVYSRRIFAATRYEPAEYEERIICRECGKRLDYVPEGADIKEGYTRAGDELI